MWPEVGSRAAHNLSPKGDFLARADYNITPGKGLVKSAVTARPDVLQRMPRSCNIVFDLLSILVKNGSATISLRDLASEARLSPEAIRRALRRLEAVGLITWTRAPGRGHRSVIALRWKTATETEQSQVIHRPQAFAEEKARLDQQKRNVYSPETSRREVKKKSLSGYAHNLPLGSRAVFWAMGQLRNNLFARPAIDGGRRAVIMACLGPAVFRAVKKGRVRTRGELGRLVGFLEARLEERRGLGLDLAATRRWAEWAVREALKAIEEERERILAGEKLIADILKEAEEARLAWQAFQGGFSLCQDGGNTLRNSSHPDANPLAEASWDGGEGRFGCVEQSGEGCVSGLEETGLSVGFDPRGGGY
jgi:DNA-binding MarR family transcriptional regulator